jgi:hypothetical protein
LKSRRPIGNLASGVVCEGHLSEQSGSNRLITKAEERDSNERTGQLVVDITGNA